MLHTCIFTYKLNNCDKEHEDSTQIFPKPATVHYPGLVKSSSYTNFLFLIHFNIILLLRFPQPEWCLSMWVLS